VRVAAGVWPEHRLHYDEAIEFLGTTDAARGCTQLRWTSRKHKGLPDGVILFDGECALCSRWVSFVIRNDPESIFRFVSIQGSAGTDIATRLGIDPRDPETNAVTSDGYVHFKSDAALAVLSRLPGWSWTRQARIIPKPLRDWLYDRIARNRYALFGRNDTCLVPTPDIARRFVD